jgi:hypothetical protein
MTEARRSILAHLALTFTDRREVLATAGLGYLLSSSSLASGAVEDLLEQWGAPKVPALHYEVEVVDPAAEGRPDVLGLDAEGHRRLILEGKFWAGLTSNQPDAYLRSLVVGGVLLMVTPKVRFPTLWTELLQACAAHGRGVGTVREFEEGRIVSVDGTTFLAIVSWRALLYRIQGALVDGGDSSLAADVLQLESLCAAMDSDAFLPIEEGELHNPSPHRIDQLLELVDDLAMRAREKQVIVRTMGKGGSRWQYARYGVTERVQLTIFLDFRRWARQAPTPLWLEVAVKRGVALQPLEAEEPRRIFYDGWSDRPVIPLYLKPHVEKGLFWTTSYSRSRTSSLSRINASRQLT